MSDIANRFSRIPRDRVLVTAPLTGQCWTAADLDATASLITDALVQHGVRPGHLVASILGNRPTALAAFLACRYAGAALLPLDRSTTAIEASAIIERLGTRIVLFGADVSAPDCCEEGRSITSELSLSDVSTDTKSYDAAVLKVTSGSTGLPKATLTTERQLCGDAESIIEAMGIRPDDIQLAVIPLSHAYAIGNLVMPLLVQGTAMVLREGFIPDRVISDAETFGAGVWPGVPFMFQHLLENPPPKWPAVLKHLISAGAPLAPATARGIHDVFGATIHAFYGTSESGGIAYDERPAPCAGPSDGIVVGLPMPGVTVTLREETGVQTGVGRIHVAAPGVSTGYAGLDDHSFIDGGFLTGDLGRFDDEGRLVLTGRVSSFINVAGRKVQPGEVEAVLRSCPGVDDVCVFGVRDPKRGETLAACVISTADEISPASIRRFCATRLAAHKVPRVVLKLSRWPVSDRGKIERDALVSKAEEALGRDNNRAML